MLVVACIRYLLFENLYFRNLILNLGSEPFLMPKIPVAPAALLRTKVFLQFNVPWTGGSDPSGRLDIRSRLYVPIGP